MCLATRPRRTAGVFIGIFSSTQVALVAGTNQTYDRFSCRKSDVGARIGYYQRRIMNAMGNQKDDEITSAELALKAHVLASDPDILAEADAGRAMAHISASVNLDEAPQDAVCSLVMDLMSYCERENIDWTEDIMSVARRRVGPAKKTNDHVEDV